MRLVFLAGMRDDPGQQCDDGETCPQVDLVEDDMLVAQDGKPGEEMALVQGYKPNGRLRERRRIPVGEDAVLIPLRVLRNAVQAAEERNRDGLD